MPPIDLKKDPILKPRKTDDSPNGTSVKTPVNVPEKTQPSSKGVSGSKKTPGGTGTPRTASVATTQVVNVKTSSWIDQLSLFLLGFIRIQLKIIIYIFTQLRGLILMGILIVIVYQCVPWTKLLEHIRDVKWGKVLYTHGQVNIREKRTVKSRRVGKLAPNAAVRVDYLEDGFYAIFDEDEKNQSLDKRIGYVYSSLLFEQPLSAVASSPTNKPRPAKTKKSSPDTLENQENEKTEQKDINADHNDKVDFNKGKSPEPGKVLNTSDTILTPNAIEAVPDSI